MELRQLIENLRSNYLYIVIAVVIFASFGFVTAKLWPVSYTAGYTLYVQKQAETTPNNDYTYDGYYAQQAVEGYADTVEGLVTSPEIMSEVLQEYLGEGLVSGYLQEYRASLKAQKVAPQLVWVAITRPTKEDADRVVSGVVNVLIKRVDSLNHLRKDKYVVTSVNKSAIVTKNQIPVVLTVIVASFLGLILSSFIVVVKAYFVANE